MLTDNLHNLDLQLGAAYGGKEVAWRERCIHARDWRAALAVPASFHLLFFVTTAVGPLSLNTSSTNVQLLAVQIAANSSLLLRCGHEPVSTGQRAAKRTLTGSLIRWQSVERARGRATPDTTPHRHYAVIPSSSEALSSS